jgi:hypothetical protein
VLASPITGGSDDARTGGCFDLAGHGLPGRCGHGRDDLGRRSRIARWAVRNEGVVSEVHTARSGKETFIDIGGTYPNQIFTAVIFAPSMAAVGDVSGLTGKTIDVTGTIQSTRASRR